MTSKNLWNYPKDMVKPKKEVKINKKKNNKKLRILQARLNKYLISKLDLPYRTYKRSELISFFENSDLCPKDSNWNSEYKFIKGQDKRLVKICSIIWKDVEYQAKVAKNKKYNVTSDSFLSTYEWRKLRYKVLLKYGRKCACCGATPEDGRQVHVDHIKPRKKYPELALEFSNLQVLCGECNHGKSNWDETDHRQDVENKEDT